MGGGVVRIEGATVVRNGSCILGPVSLEIKAGERWVLLGPNGSGKSTLLGVMGTRVWPSGGVVSIFGGTLGRVDVRDLRPAIAMVSASLARLLRGDICVLDLVLSGADGALETWWGHYDESTRARAVALVERAGLVERMDAPFGVLSEGERQGALIARALMGEPRLLLLDEPAAGLDLGARERLLVLLESIASSSALDAMVLVTHHVEEIPRQMTHCALLRDGALVASGGIDSVLTVGGLRDCFGVDVELVTTDGRRAARARL